MDTALLSYGFALGATLCFATASIAYAEYSKRVSVLWMNCFKATVALLALIVTIPLFTDWHLPSLLSIGGLMLSGLIGLNIGDLFLLKAFTRLGVSRTLILFGFQPLMVGIGAYFFFGQSFDPSRLLAVLFMIACLFTFSLERYRADKSWEVAGLLAALMGVLLDSCGILITRAAFGDSPQLTPIEGHFYRCIGAVIGFAAMAQIRPFGLIQNFRRWNTKSRVILILAALGGTYLSLLLYLSAVKIGHLASIASIAITGPMFAATLETVVHRRPPSRYLLVAFVFFCLGFYTLLRTA